MKNHKKSMPRISDQANNNNQQKGSKKRIQSLAWKRPPSGNNNDGKGIKEDSFKGLPQRPGPKPNQN